MSGCPGWSDVQAAQAELPGGRRGAAEVLLNCSLPLLGSPYLPQHAPLFRSPVRDGRKEPRVPALADLDFR